MLRAIRSESPWSAGLKQLQEEMNVGELIQGALVHQGCCTSPERGGGGGGGSGEIPYPRLKAEAVLQAQAVDSTSCWCRAAFLGERKGPPTQHYHFQEVLGRGTFGVVSKVVAKDSGLVRVLKAVDKKTAASKGLPESKLMAEIDGLRSLDHPSLLRFFEYFTDDQALHILTDHLRYGELIQAVDRAHKKNQLLPEQWSRSVFRQICEGVAYCHGRRVVHRDLKLENVMLASLSPPQAVIIDMGLVERMPLYSAASSSCPYRSPSFTGSIPTMAPEVFSRSSSFKCDVWSLGCCLFGLLVKKPKWIEIKGQEMVYPYPFIPPQNRSTEELEAYRKRQEAGPSLLNTVCTLAGAGARHLMSLMLQHDENERPDIQQVLKHRWFTSEFDPPHKAVPASFSREQLHSIESFLQAPALEEAALFCAASQLPLQELSEFRELFRSLDEDRDGCLDRCEITKALQAGPAGWSFQRAKEVSQRWTKSGSVEFSRFVAALLLTREDLLMPQLKATFLRMEQAPTLQRLLTAGTDLAALTQSLKLLARSCRQDVKP